jgi:tetratricopeptide (TPR) repeat protein
MANKKLFIVSSITLVACLIAAYSNHFNNDFHFDDSHTIVSNPFIRNIHNIPKMFYSPEMFSSLPTHWGLRPLVTISLTIDYWLGGNLKPFYFQLSTFIWYAVLCVMLLLMYYRLMRNSVNNKYLSFAVLFATSWFSFHTANAETVNYIISRSDVISTTCIVFSFYFFIAYPAKRKYLFYIIPAAIGILAKETIATLVVLFFFYILLFEKQVSVPDMFKSKNFKIVWQCILQVLPAAVIIVAIQLYLLNYGSNHIAKSNIPNPLGYYILSQSYVWVRYMIAFFIPANLTADSDWGVIYNIFDERIIIGLCFIIGLIFAIFTTSRKKETRPISFGLIWFAVSLLPTSLVPFAEVTNDHRMFYAFIGLSMAVTTAASLWIEKILHGSNYKKAISSIVICACFFIVGLNAYGVHERNKVWATEESLWHDVTIKSPANGRGLMNYGLTQMEKGNYAVADVNFEKATQYTPYYDVLFINIGVLKGVMNKTQEAEANFKKAIELNKDATDAAYYYYARYLNGLQKYTEAIPLAEKALSINPHNIETLHLLSSLYQSQEQWDKLLDAANKTLAILPNDKEGNNYLNAARNKSKINIPIGIKSLTAADYINQSLFYYQQKEFKKCIEAAQQALQIDPNNADAYNNIGAAYNAMSEWKKAYEYCSKALEINPEHKLAKGNLNWAKSNIK